MASRKMTDPHLIQYLTENYENEKWLRMHWVEQHMEELNRAAILDRELTNYTPTDIKKAVIAACMPSLSKFAVLGAAFKRTAPIKDSRLVKVGDIKECEPTMKPITDKQRAALFKSKKEYLKLRYKVPPHKRYNYIETVNMGYGWNLEERFKLQLPEYGKVMKLQRIKAIGPQPDPIHYKECPKTFCNNI